MPSINIPPKVRFRLYILAAIALLTISYLYDKKWAGDAEVRYVTGVAALMQVLAAANTNTKSKAGDEQPEDPAASSNVGSPRPVTGTRRRTPPTPPPDGQDDHEMGAG